MNCVKSITLIFFATLLPMVLVAQHEASHQIEIGIPEVALIGIVSEGSADVNFFPFSGMEAGSTVVVAAENENNSMWLNYTSIKNGNSHSRKVMAMVQGEHIDGIHLKVTPRLKCNLVSGDIGEAGMTTTLTDRPTELISGIGSCYTGRGVDNGFNLVYELEIDESQLDFTKLHQQIFTFNVLYTLTD